MPLQLVVLRVAVVVVVVIVVVPLQRRRWRRWRPNADPTCGRVVRPAAAYTQRSATSKQQDARAPISSRRRVWASRRANTDADGGERAHAQTCVWEASCTCDRLDERLNEGTSDRSIDQTSATRCRSFVWLLPLGTHVCHQDVDNIHDDDDDDDNDDNKNSDNTRRRRRRRCRQCRRKAINYELRRL